MKKTLIIPILFLLFNLLSYAKEKIIVLPFTSSDEELISSSEITKIFFDKISNNDNYDILIPSESVINFLLKKQNIDSQNINITNLDKLSNISPNLSAKYIITGYVQKLDESNIAFLSIFEASLSQKIAGHYFLFGDISEVVNHFNTSIIKLLEATEKNYENLPIISIINSKDNIYDLNDYIFANILNIDIANTGEYAVIDKFNSSIITDNKIILSNYQNNIKEDLQVDYVLINNISKIDANNYVESSFNFKETQLNQYPFEYYDSDSIISNANLLSLEVANNILYTNQYTQSFYNVFEKYKDNVNVENIKNIAVRFDINALDKNGDSPLILAVILGNVEIVEALLENGADVNTLNANRDSALTIATKFENIKIIEILLNND